MKCEKNIKAHDHFLAGECLPRCWALCVCVIALLLDGKLCLQKCVNEDAPGTYYPCMFGRCRYVTYDEPAVGDCLFEALSRQLPRGVDHFLGVVS